MTEHLDGAISFRKVRGLRADPILNELLAELNGFAALLKKYGTEVAIESAIAREAWAGLEEDAKRKVLKSFSTYHRNCRELHASGVSLRDNKGFVFHCLKKANLYAQDKIDGYLANEYMIEVYSLENVQIFRSINFFDYCNYSLLDLLAREWMALYERLSSVTESIFNEIHGAVAAKELRTFQTPSHTMRERDANPSGIFRTDFLCCCPLYSAPGQVSGYLLALDVEELDLAPREDHKVTFLR